MNVRSFLVRRRVVNGVCEVDYVDEAAAKAAKAGLPHAKELLATAEALKTLAHPNRLRVLEALDGRELCVCDLAEVLGISMSGTSQQLRELRQLGAVEFRVAGKLAYYSIADRFWLELGREIAEHLNDAENGVPVRRIGHVGVT